MVPAQVAVQEPLLATGRLHDQVADAAAGGWLPQDVTSGTTVTVKNVSAVAPPNADVARQMTVVGPMGNSEPLAGEQVTFGGVAVPSVAMGVAQVTTALLVVVLAVMLGGGVGKDGTGAASSSSSSSSDEAHEHMHHAAQACCICKQAWRTSCCSSMHAHLVRMWR